MDVAGSASLQIRSRVQELPEDIKCQLKHHCPVTASRARVADILIRIIISSSSSRHSKVNGSNECANLEKPQAVLSADRVDDRSMQSPIFETPALGQRKILQSLYRHCLSGGGQDTRGAWCEAAG